MVESHTIINTILKFDFGIPVSLKTPTNLSFDAETLSLLHFDKLP